MANNTGKKFGGREKGTPNKKTQDVQERLKAMGCDPIVGMARIAQGDSPCRECQTKGKQNYSVGIAGLYVDVDRGTLMTCKECLGTGREPIPAKLAGEMLKELAQYVAPRLKAIEHSGELKTAPIVSVTIEGEAPVKVPKP